MMTSLCMIGNPRNTRIPRTSGELGYERDFAMRSKLDDERMFGSS